MQVSMHLTGVPALLAPTYIGGAKDGTIKQYTALDNALGAFHASLPTDLVNVLAGIGNLDSITSSGELLTSPTVSSTSSPITSFLASTASEKPPCDPQAGSMAKRRRRPRQSKEEIGLALRRASLGKATGMVFEVIDCTYTVVAKGRREKVLVDGVSARLEPGQVLALLGPSGAGKTTLLSMLTLQRGIGRAHGKALLNGQPFTPALYRQHAAYVAQHDQVSSQCIRSCAALSLPTHS